MNTQYLKDKGFTLYNTGGGCMQYYLESTNGSDWYLLVSDSEGELLDDDVNYEEVSVGVYKDDGDFVLMYELDTHQIETGIDHAIALLTMPIYTA